MASWIGWKKRTTSFCYVHKCSVCDDCTAAKSAGSSPASSAVNCEAHCFLGNYFDWLSDSDYAWPPRCNLCNRTITADATSLCRLVCKDLFHRDCLREHITRQLAQQIGQKDIKCPTCNLLMVDPATQPRTKLRETVAQFVNQVAQGGSVDVSSSSSSPATSLSSSSPITAASPNRSNGSFSSPSSASPSSRVLVDSSRYSPAVRELMSKALSSALDLRPLERDWTYLSLPTAD